MLFFLLATMAPAEPVVVSSLQTTQLAQDCSGKDADPRASFCSGYIIGVFDALSLSHQICPSADGVSTLKIVATVRKFIRTNRKSWSSAPSFVVRDALKGSFSCRLAKDPPLKPRVRSRPAVRRSQ